MASSQKHSPSQSSQSKILLHEPEMVEMRRLRNVTFDTGTTNCFEVLRHKTSSQRVPIASSDTRTELGKNSYYDRTQRTKVDESRDLLNDNEEVETSDLHYLPRIAFDPSELTANMINKDTISRVVHMKQPRKDIIQPRPSSSQVSSKDSPSKFSQSSQTSMSSGSSRPSYSKHGHRNAGDESFLDHKRAGKGEGLDYDFGIPKESLYQQDPPEIHSRLNVSYVKERTTPPLRVQRNGPHQTKRRKTCERCRRHEEICQYKKGRGTPCERCERLGRQCVFKAKTKKASDSEHKFKEETLDALNDTVLEDAPKPRLPERPGALANILLAINDHKLSRNLTLKLRSHSVNIPKTCWVPLFKRITEEYETLHETEIAGSCKTESGILDELKTIAHAGKLERDEVVRLWGLDTDFVEFWNQFYICQCSYWPSETSLQRLASVISHFQVGGSMPRRLSCKYRYNNISLYSRDVYNEVQSYISAKGDLDLDGLLSTFEDIVYLNDPSPFYFLECWIEVSKGSAKSLKVIAETLLKVQHKFSTCTTAVSQMNETQLGNLLATVIRSCSNGFDSLYHGQSILISLCQLYGKAVNCLIFQATIHRLEKNDIVAAFMMFTEYFRQTEQFRQMDLEADEVDESRIWEKNLDLFEPFRFVLWDLGQLSKVFNSENDGNPTLRTTGILSACFHIILYVAVHERWLDDDSYKFVKEILVEQIGEVGVRSIWTCIGLQEIYFRRGQELETLSKLEVFLQREDSISHSFPTLVELDGTPMKQMPDFGADGMKIPDPKSKPSVYRIPMPSLHRSPAITYHSSRRLDSGDDKQPKINNKSLYRYGTWPQSGFFRRVIDTSKRFALRYK